jgi:hypothetical protein
MMCGYCAEGIPIELAKALTAGVEWSTELGEYKRFTLAYLQESPDVFPALVHVEDELHGIVHKLHTEGVEVLVERELTNLRVAFCRILETLVRYGFQSPEYQELINLPVAMRILETCSLLAPTFNEQVLRSASLLKNLFCGEFFIDEAVCDRVLSHPELMAECEIVLNSYAEWWHISRTYQRFIEQPGWRTDIEDLYKVVVCVFFSYLIIEKIYPEHQSIARIVERRPKGAGATWEGLDFWLQRRAALTFYKVASIDYFWPFIRGPRPPLTYYLLVKGKLDAEAKQRLRETIPQLSYYNPDRDWPLMNRPKYIATCSHYFIMDYLQQ